MLLCDYLLQLDDITVPLQYLLRLSYNITFIYLMCLLLILPSSSLILSSKLDLWSSFSLSIARMRASFYCLSASVSCAHLSSLCLHSFLSASTLSWQMLSVSSSFYVCSLLICEILELDSAVTLASLDSWSEFTWESLVLNSVVAVDSLCSCSFVAVDSFNSWSFVAADSFWSCSLVACESFWSQDEVTCVNLVSH